jgi:hypothetical protein
LSQLYELRTDRTPPAGRNSKKSLKVDDLCPYGGRFIFLEGTPCPTHWPY